MSKSLAKEMLEESIPYIFYPTKRMDKSDIVIQKDGQAYFDLVVGGPAIALMFNVRILAGFKIGSDIISNRIGR